MSVLGLKTVLAALLSHWVYNYEIVKKKPNRIHYFLPMLAGENRSNR